METSNFMNISQSCQLNNGHKLFKSTTIPLEETIDPKKVIWFYKKLHFLGLACK